jgi:hypothetical protein
MVEWVMAEWVMHAVLLQSLQLLLMGALVPESVSELLQSPF